jgi:hypothetical protein
MNTAANSDWPQRYEIKIVGHLDGERMRWFEEFSVTLLPSGETLLVGPIVDQAALHGVLSRIRDLGVQLLSVNQSETGVEE